MHRILSVLVYVFISIQLTAGGLITNTNQSARWSRMMCLDATHTLDAVYYNPAGLTLLPKGFYLSVNNQVISQTRTILSDYKYLTGSPKEYTGKVSSMLFPGIYATYRTGKLAFSLGINPIGGGGSTVYEDGLPSFEMVLAALPPLINAFLEPFGFWFAPGPTPEVTGYNADIYLKENSVFMGYQLNASYKLSDIVSMAIGGRYVSAKNTIKWHVKDVTIDVDHPDYGGTKSAGSFFREMASDPGTPPLFAAYLYAYSYELDSQTNFKAHIEQEGRGFTPVLSLNINPIEELNIAAKYEFRTRLHLINKVIDGKDANGLYVDGETVVADMPAMLSVGAQFKASEKVLVSAGIHSYFDKNNDYDGSLDTNINMIDNNYIEMAFGAQYSVSDKIDLSVGFVVANSGVNDDYQSDIRYSLSSYTFGGGMGYKLNEKFSFNLGVTYAWYSNYVKTFETIDPANLQTMSVSETYGKNSWLIGLGVDFSLFR